MEDCSIQFLRAERLSFHPAELSPFQFIRLAGKKNVFPASDRPSSHIPADFLVGSKEFGEGGHKLSCSETPLNFSGCAIAPLCDILQSGTVVSSFLIRKNCSGGIEK